MSRKVLSDQEMASFAERGYVRVTDALTSAHLEEVRAVVWQEMAKQYGILESEPATWRSEWCGVNKDKIDAVAGVRITPRLKEAVDQLLGSGGWRPLRSLGGLMFTMPEQNGEPWEVVTKAWHFDNDPRSYRNRMDELMLFTFYSSVQPQGGGTLILSGSHRIVTAFMDTPEARGHLAHDFTSAFVRSHSYLAQLQGEETRTMSSEQFLATPVEVYGVEAQVVELTGEPGDAILCHPTLFHAKSRNTSDATRIMRRTNFRRKK